VFRPGRRYRSTALLLVLLAVAAVFHFFSEQVRAPCGNLPSPLETLSMREHAATQNKGRQPLAYMSNTRYC
ncbi:MAG: hypothetical protein ACKOJB_04515, partial [Chthoniobacterales bacterium]